MFAAWSAMIPVFFIESPCTTRRISNLPRLSKEITATVEHGVSGQRRQNSGLRRDTPRHLIPAVSPIEVERVFRVSSGPLPTKTCSRLSGARQGLVSGIFAWESFFLGTERSRQRHLVVALNPSCRSANTTPRLKPEAA